MNILRMGAVFGCVVVASGAVHVVHAFQVQRQASALLAQAQRYEEQRDVARTTRYLTEYLTLVPSDRDTLAHLALLTASNATAPLAKLEAAIRCDQALRLNTGRDDLRRLLARLWLELGRYSDSAARALELTNLDTTDTDAWTMLAHAYDGEGKHMEAARAYKTILEQEPANIDAAVALAYLCRESLNSPRSGNREMDVMVAANPQSARASLARHSYRVRYGMEEDADTDLETALKLSPFDSAVLLTAADRAIGKRDFSGATRFLEKGQKAHPDDTRFDASLGRLFMRQGKTSEAMAAYRRGLETDPEDYELLWHLALLLIDQGGFDESEAIIARMRRLLPYAPYHDLLRGRTLEQQGDVPHAAELYEKAGDASAQLPELQSLAYSRLAECHASMEQWDLALTAFRHAAQSDRQAVAPRFGLAQTLERLGRIDEATTEYEQIAGFTNCPFEVLVGLARARLAMQARQPEEQRAWGKFHEFLDGLLERAPDHVELVVLKAHALAIQGRNDEAISLARAACESHRDESVAWLGLAATHRLGSDSENARKTLDRAIEELGDRIPFRLAQAKMLATSGRPREALTILQQCLERANGAEHAACLRAVVEIAVADPNNADARHLLEELQRRRPDDVFIRLAVADASFASADGESVAAQSNDSQKLAGSLQSLERFEKARTLWRGGKGDEAALKEAKRILEELKGRRPQWPQLHALAGMIEESRGDSDSAIKNYAAAQEYGDRSLEIARRQIQLLGLRGRYQEINKVLERLNLSPRPIELLARFSAAVSFQSGNTEQAVRLAKGMVAAKPNDYSSYLWLGRLLWLTGQREESENALRTATSLGPRATETWAALVSFYTVADQPDSARSTIDEAKKSLEPTQAVVAVPQYFELARLTTEAEELFDAASAEETGNSQLQQIAADFYFRNAKLKKAEQCLRRASAIEPNSNRVRQSLAWVIASQRNYATWQEAVQLIEQNLATPAATNQDKEIRAMLLAMRPNRRNRSEAITLLEELCDSAIASPEDRFLLAQFYFRDDQARKGRELIANLLSRGESKPALVAACVDLLLEHREVTEGKRWLTELESRAPEQDSLALRVRLLDLERRPDEAVAALRKRLDSYTTPPSDRLLRDLSRLLSRLQWSKSADGLFHEIVGDRTERLPDLVLWLRKNGRIDAALAACQKAAERGQTELAALLGITLLHDTDPSAERIALVESWFDRAIQQSPQSKELLLSDALLCHLKSQHEESVRRFSNLLAQDVDSLRTLNNMAWVISEGLGRPADALERIELALRQFGPVPNLLDTRGVILARLGRYDEAIADLESAISESSSIPRLFHLASACFRGGQHEAARRAIEKIDATGPITASLREAQREEFLRMKDEL